MQPNSTLGAGPVLIAALLILGFLALVVMLTRAARAEDERLATELPVEEQLYRALILALSAPMPYRRDEGPSGFWHQHQTAAHPEWLPADRCSGCIIERALTAYERENGVRRRAALRIVHPELDGAL